MSEPTSPPSPTSLFGFAGKTPTDLENLINILKHSSDLPKGFCVIASHRLPIEKQHVLNATLQVLEGISLDSPDSDEMLLFGILLTESLLDSPIVRKFTKKEQYQNLASRLLPLIFKWSNSITEQHPPQLSQLFESTSLRCFAPIRVIFKAFPVLVSKLLAGALEEYSTNGNVLRLVGDIVQKLKFRKVEGIRNGYLELAPILLSLVANQLNREKMDDTKELAIDLMANIYRMVRNKALIEEYVNADTLNASPLTLTTVREYMQLVDEEDQRNRTFGDQGESSSDDAPPRQKRQNASNVRGDDYTLSKTSSSSSLTSQLQFNENSSITKELLKAKIKKSVSSGAPVKGPAPSFKRMLTQLTHLSLENCNITSIDNLQYCVNLRVLYLSHNQIFRIEGLENLVHLTQLYLQNNQIQNIEGLDTLTALKKLHLEQNCISRLEGLTQNRLLTELYLSNQRQPTLQDNSSNTEFTFDLATLYNLQHSLSVLSLSNCRVQNASDLSVLNNLQTLDLSKNEISSLDYVLQLLTNNYVLYELDLSDNPICSATKYRDQIIINSTHSLQVLDKKPIQANVRSFLLNKRNHQLSAKGKRKPATAPTDQIDLQLKIARPRLYTGPKQKENQHGISMQNLDVKR